MSRTVITDANAPNPMGSYNQAVVSNGFIFTAGQVGIDPDTGKFIEESFKSRVNQVFKNLSAILEEVVYLMLLSLQFLLLIWLIMLK